MEHKELTLICHKCRNFYSNPEWAGMCWQCYQLDSDLPIPSKKWYSFFRKSSKEKVTLSKAAFRDIVSKSGLECLTPRFRGNLATSLFDFSKLFFDQKSVRSTSTIFSQLYGYVTQMYSEHFKETESDNFRRFLDWVEETVVEMMHPHIYACPEDELMDVEFRHKIFRMAWLEGRHVGCHLDLEDENVSKFIQLASDCLIGLSSHRTTIAKLQAITDCCAYVLDALIYQGTKQSVNADDFVPALIYVVVHSNPPQLISNTRFISRFSAPQRLQTGKMAYYFTNICSVIQFISHLSQSNLIITQEEYDRLMSPRRDSLGSIIRSLALRIRSLSLETANLRGSIDDLSSSFYHFTR